MGDGSGAARTLFEHGVGHAQERAQRERDRAGHTLGGEVAHHFDQLVAIKFQAAGFEGDGRVLRGVEVVFALNMLIEKRVAGIHGFRVDGHVHRTCFRLTIQNDLAAGLVKPAQLDGLA